MSGNFSDFEHGARADCYSCCRKIYGPKIEASYHAIRYSSSFCFCALASYQFRKRDLGRLYLLGLTSRPLGPAREADAKKAFHQLELAYGQSDPMRRDSLLPDLAKTGFEAGLIDDAKKYAEKMLDDDNEG